MIRFLIRLQPLQKSTFSGYSAIFIPAQWVPRTNQHLLSSVPYAGQFGCPHRTYSQHRIGFPPNSGAFKKVSVGIPKYSANASAILGSTTGSAGFSRSSFFTGRVKQNCLPLPYVLITQIIPL